MNYFRKGFTLVELLIVIVVIGILSGIMMFSSSKATSTARANTIIKNLKNLSIAAMTLYLDSPDIGRDIASNVLKRRVLEYTTNGNASAFNDYMVSNDNGTWWAGCPVPSNTEVAAKLTSRADIANLKGSENTNTHPTEASLDYNGEAVVWTLIRSGSN